MRRVLFALAALLLTLPTVFARGLCIPEDVKLPPLAMVNHNVTVKIDEQVAVTTVEQSFRNHTPHALEATYLFPVPRGATVNKFTMWIDGKETAGELLDAKKANDIYTGIVRRMQDPALLEYMGNGLLRLKMFPVPPAQHGKYGDVKIKLSYSTLLPMEGGVLEFLYPMKTDGKATRLLEEFSIKIDINSKTPIQSIYSPTHAVELDRKSDTNVQVNFAKNQAILDKDFQLFIGRSTSAIGLTSMMYRPVKSEDGYFLLLLSPTIEAAKEKSVPRDLVLVLDTSGSMSDTKMSQAKQALRACLKNVAEKKTDRFALVAFSTTVRTFADDLTTCDPDQIEKALKWIDDLQSGGGTAILPALNKALDFRSKDTSRNFTVAFFTDGQPTIDETNPTKIVKAITDKNSVNTRIFTFGVGDDVNAAMLDQLADSTRAVTTYVRPSEDIGAKSNALIAKLSHPVMTNVKISATNGIKLHEMYPVQMPDLFFGGQLVLFGRYSGDGHAAIKLNGMLGGEQKEIVYELDFADKTENSRGFVEQLWARRKVGYLLDQIRVNGESKEVVDDVTKLAKKYGIATPYTSYLVVPDAVMPVAQNFERKQMVIPPPGAGGGSGFGGGMFGGPGGPGAPAKLDELQKLAQASKDGLAINGRGVVQEKQLDEALKKMKPEDRNTALGKSLEQARADQKNNDDANKNYKGGQAGLKDNQSGRLGVDLAEASNKLRQQDRLTLSANKQAYGRNCVEVAGNWVDEQFTSTTRTVNIKAQSDAYFAILQAHPEMKEVYLLGNNLVWITPSGVAIALSDTSGDEKLTDKQISELFTAKK
jgi:Ca-activated chloride channel homolog